MIAPEPPAPRSPLRRALPAALALAALLPAGAARAADPFYLRLLASGQEAYEQQNYGAARHDLRIACFGLLAEPEVLASCLVSLALTDAATGDIESFNRVFRRIVEVENRFDAYTRADLPDARRTAFETAMARHVPKKELALLPEFEARAERAAIARLTQLPARERRSAIEARLRENPSDPLYLMLLAELETAEGRSRRALDALRTLIAVDPENAPGRCLRGRLLAADRQCLPALPDLPACAGSAVEQEAQLLELDCLVRERRWSEAGNLLDSLPDAVLELPEVARLAPRVDQELAEIAAAEAAAQAAAAAAESAPEPPPPAAEAGLEPEGPSLEAELAQLRQQMTQVSSLEQLGPIAERSRSLANGNPESTEAQFLAGEAAYLARRWNEAASFFRRAGDPPPGRSLLRFYMAVSYFEAGDAAAAARLLEGALPGLERTPFVQDYIDRILGGPLDGEAAAGDEGEESD